MEATTCEHPSHALSAWYSLLRARGEWIVRHPRILRISMTGSTGAGKAVMREAAEELKDLTLELGGNDPAIVLDDVNPKKMAQYVQRPPSYTRCTRLCRDR